MDKAKPGPAKSASSISPPVCSRLATSRLSRWVAAGFLATATMVAYLPALSGGFIWDDDALVTNSPIVQAPDGLYRIWLTAEPEDYWPMTNSSFWLEWRLWGAR